jgi:hypothetical protein
MDATSGLITAVLSFVCAGFGAYVGSYLRKRGENLATHEDLDKIVAQMEATTEATKAIEARISNEVWDRQRQWELKREVLLAAAKRLAAAQEALNSHGTAMELHSGPDPNPYFAQAVVKSGEEWFSAIAELDESRLLADIVCEPETARALDAFAIHAKKAASLLSAPNIAEYKTSWRTIFENGEQAKRAIRRELGLPV